jgi:hypothetical protein
VTAPPRVTVPTSGRAFVAVNLGVALCAWCGWVSGFRRSTTAAELTWVCSIAAVATVDLLLWRGRRGLRPGWRVRAVAQPWPRPGRGGSRRALMGVAPWLGLLVVAVAWDVLGLDSGPHQYHLTISALSQAYRPLNAGLLLLWMLVGVGYELARVRAPDLSPPGVSSPRPGPPDPCASLAVGAVAPLHQAPAAAPALLLPPSPCVGVAFWVAVPLAGVVTDLAARRSGGTVANAEEAVRFVGASKVVNAMLILVWVFAGYHLFAR